MVTWSHDGPAIQCTALLCSFHGWTLELPALVFAPLHKGVAHVTGQLVFGDAVRLPDRLGDG